MPISNDLIGARLPGATYRWGPDETTVYALGVGAKPPDELEVLDELRGPVALPTFALVANWWAMKDVRTVLDPGAAPMVHAAQSLDLARPMASSGEVRVEAEVAAVWDKGRNSIVEVVGTGSDDEGVIFRTRSATMVLGVGGWGGERGPSASDDQPTRPADATYDDEIRAEQAAMYRLSGDRNRLHIDPAAARQAGFDDVFLHGLCTLGFAARALIATIGGGDVASLRSIGCRFAKPVFLGRSLTTDVWNLGNGRASFRTRQGDAVALTGGTARFER